MSSISVIIPAYNAEKYLAEAIDSALNQSRAAKEIIVVDASRDRTVEVARSVSWRMSAIVTLFRLLQTIIYCFIAVTLVVYAIRGRRA